MCDEAYLMRRFVEEFFMRFNSTDLSVIISLCMFIESIFKSEQKKKIKKIRSIYISKKMYTSSYQILHHYLENQTLNIENSIKNAYIHFFTIHLYNSV